ncbi:MAG: GGDEF domain-containing protein [Spirochaetes bacterium]|nr:MAG: GGDEF domain-containing protein [Spirochaetota bacterium]
MIEDILRTKENLELDILSDIGDESVFNFIIESLKVETASPYSTLMEAIFHYKASEPEAELIWKKIMLNQKEMERRCRRKIGLKTAVVDYFSANGMDEKIVIFIKDNMVNVIDATIRDQLTGLFSKEFIKLEIDREFKRAKRYRLPLSLMFIDIDDFKRFNDRFGHSTGDQVLRNTGKLLLQKIRHTDKTGRYGGEEFIVLLPHTAKPDALKIGRKLCREFRETASRTGDVPEEVTVSIGVAEISEEMQDASVLIDIADKAMYQAKSLGKNRCYSF